MQDNLVSKFVRTEQREVTLLLADLRGFTELAASLETVPVICELLAHVMDYLTEAVVKHDGHVVDYYGDGLMAMWNAPAEQPNHAELACRAALAMLESLPEVTADWIGLINTELCVGIGVHTAEAQVGNAGSKRHVKYGPRGPGVNLTSRVEGATKELHVPFVATRSTVDKLPADFAAQRLCRARLPGLHEPADLYSVHFATGDAVGADAWKKYTEALRCFEAGLYQHAGDELSKIDPVVSGVPLVFLREQVEQALNRELRRRSTDRPTTDVQGVVTIHAK